jgi:hypothetical protein
MQTLTALVPDLSSNSGLVKDLHRVDSSVKASSEKASVARRDLDGMAEKRTALVDGFALSTSTLHSLLT